MIKTDILPWAYFPLVYLAIPLTVSNINTPGLMSDLYLRDVNFGPFGACHHHGLEVVVLREGLLGGRTRFVSSVVQDPVDLVLEGLSQRVTWGGLQLVVVGLLNDLEVRTRREEVKDGEQDMFRRGQKCSDLAF